MSDLIKQNFELRKENKKLIIKNPNLKKELKKHKMLCLLPIIELNN